MRITFLKVFSIFIPLLAGSAESFAVARPKLVINQISDYYVSFVVSSPRIISGSKPVTRKLVFEAACDGSRYQPLGARVNPRRLELFYDSPPLDVRCSYRARVTYRSTRKIAKKVFSNTVWVTINESDLTQEFIPPTPPPTPNHDYSGPNLPQQFAECRNGVEVEMIERTNYHRQQNGLGLVSFSALLHKAARMHSIRMGLSGVLSHEGWIDEIMGLGFDGSFAAQNIANAINDPVVVVEMWMTSEMHRLNILSDRATTIGVACVRDRNGLEWWTMNLGG